MIPMIEAIEAELQKEGYTILNADGTYNRVAAAIIARTLISVRRPLK
jgi:hypothetical protein